MKPRPAILIWRDHEGQGEEWQEKIEFKRMRPKKCYTCTWVMEVTDEHILILGTFGSRKDSEVSGGNALERRSIDRIIYLDKPTGWKAAKKFLEGLEEF